MLVSGRVYHNGKDRWRSQLPCHWWKSWPRKLIHRTWEWRSPFFLSLRCTWGAKMGTGHIYQASLFHNMWRNILLSSWWVPKGSVDFGLWWRWENRFTKPRPRLWSQNLEVKIVLQNGGISTPRHANSYWEGASPENAFRGSFHTYWPGIWRTLHDQGVFHFWFPIWGVATILSNKNRWSNYGRWFVMGTPNNIIYSKFRENRTSGIPPNMRSKTISIPYVGWLLHSDSHNGLYSNLYSKRIFWIGAWKSDYQKFIPRMECRVYYIHFPRM